MGRRMEGEVFAYNEAVDGLRGHVGESKSHKALWIGMYKNHLTGNNGKYGGGLWGIRGSMVD